MSIKNKPHRVMWTLEALSEDILPDWVRDAPNMDMFRLSFPDEESAQLFIAEIQRFMGGRVLHLLENGIKIKPVVK